jgi:IS30 family transposase
LKTTLYAIKNLIQDRKEGKLIRQYLKKGSDFVSVTANELSGNIDTLNTRPRKCLLFATPNEIFSSA